MRRLLAAAAAAAILLSACGDDARGRVPADPTPTTTTTTSATETADAAPTSAAPTTVTSTAPTAETTTATESAPEAAPAPTTTTAPAPPAVTACDDDGLSQDILGFPGGVSVDFCENGWAVATYPNAPGAPEFIAEQVDGRWSHAVAMGDPVCQDDLSARGAPASVSTLVPPCGETAAPTESPTEPAGPCVISTEQYGDTHADLVAVACDEARAEWELAEANTEPSWTIPLVTPSGWECFVTPYDATSKAAGSCYGPDGTAYFTLYLP